MEAEAVQYIADLARQGAGAATLLEVEGRTYSTVALHAQKPPEPAPLEVHTLTGLRDYLRENGDGVSGDTAMVHVVSPTRVDVVSLLREPWNQRPTFARARCLVTPFPFGSWMSLEELNIALQSRFEDEGDRAAVLRLVGNVRDEAVRTHGDDGVTQQVTAKAGVATVEAVEVPNPVDLAPFRTFPEVQQPGSRFVFRLRKGREAPEGALFEADGGEWQNVAIARIADWLGEAVEGFTIIA